MGEDGLGGVGDLGFEDGVEDALDGGGRGVRGLGGDIELIIL